jgi:CubicO group peptidase (beta-lactamase class C family)
MAGLLVEKLSGEEYEKYMLAHVLQPLGVTTAHPVYPSPEMVELMALPYMPGGTGKPTPVAQVHFDVYPAGDIYQTAEEMARFLAMHLNGGVYHGKRILSEASIKAAHEPQFGGTYAFGWDVKKDPATGHTIIAHSGGIPGQSSMMMGDVDAKVGVYFMSNSGGPPAIAQAALKLLRGETYVEKPAPKAIMLEPAVLDRYVGDYEVSDDFAMHVRRDGSRLVVQQGNDQTKTELLASAPATFFVKGQDWTITFGTNASGAVEKMVLDTGSDRMEMKRKK